MHIIDVNDWELQCFTASGDLVYGVPCAASFDERNVFLGAEALARAKIFPQTFTSNYLYRGTSEQSAKVRDLERIIDLRISGPMGAYGHATKSPLGRPS